MTARTIFVWQPLLTSHMLHTVLALRDAAGLRLVVCVTRTEDNVRAAQGWILPGTDRLETIELPRIGTARRAREILDANPHAVHLFGSPFEHFGLMQTLARAVRCGRPTFLVAEAYARGAVAYFTRPTWRDRVKSALRPALYAAYGLLLKGRVSGVFAISARSVEQFRAMGISADCIFPFGYFVPSTGHSATRAPGRPLCAVFIGTLIETKGIVELVAAGKRLRASAASVEVDVYGPGDPDDFGLAEAGLHYRGRVAFGAAQAVFADYDLAILPSRHDGWGVVVNEALLAGVPVLVSDAVGAQALVKRWACGIVIPAGVPAALADALVRLADDPARLQRYAAGARLAAQSITPETAGRYMWACIAARLDGHTAPPSPWYAP